MSTSDSSTSYLSDRDRDARKYVQLVRTLSDVTTEIRTLLQSHPIDVERFLEKVIPHYSKAFEAQHSFLLRLSQSKDGVQYVESVYSTIPQGFGSLPSNVLFRLFAQDKAQVINTSQSRYQELANLGIQNAIVAPLHALDRDYLIGLCNKRNAGQYPFLAADRMVLESLLASIEASLRTMQRLHMENAAIAAINQEITTGDIENLSRVIATQVAKLSGVKYTAVFSYDETHQELVSQFVWDQSQRAALPNEYRLPLLKRNINTYVAKNSEISDINKLGDSKQPLYRATLDGDITSDFCVPLVSQETLVGVLYVASMVGNGISAEARSSVERLAPLAAVALQNVKLLVKEREDNRLDEEIIRLHNAVADVLLEEEQTEQILRALQETLPEGHNLFIATYEAHDNQIRLYLVYENDRQIENLDEHPLYRPRGVGERAGLIDYMLCHKESLLILDVPDFQAWEDAEEIEEAFSANLRCCLVLELRLPQTGETIGWIGLRGTQKTHMFAPKLRTLLEKTAPYLAVVLHNSKEYAQRAREREVVSEFQTKVSGLSETQAAEVEELSRNISAALTDLRIYTGDLLIALYDVERTKITAPVVYLNGRSLTEEEKAADPAYRDRQLEERNGFIEWILTNDKPILAKTSQGIQDVAKKYGITSPPLRFKCWLGVPMRVSGRPVGVIALRSTQDENLFADTHRELLETIASQAAVTLENARKHQNIRELLEQQDALLHASRAIADAGIERDVVLKTIVEQATMRTGSHIGSIYLLNQNRDALELIVAYPPDLFSILKKSNTRISVDDPVIIARAVRENEAQLVEDVTAEPEYVDFLSGTTKAELAVVLRGGNRKDGTIRGVINVEHRDVGGLGKNDRRFLISLSNLAVSAIQNAEQAKELGRSKSIAVMGAWGADIVHDINREVSRIREIVLQIKLENELSPELSQELDTIDAIADGMQLPELPEQVPFEPDDDQDEMQEDSTSISELDAVITSEVEDFLASRVTPTKVQIDFALGCSGVQVNIHHTWLRRLLRHYLNNAERHPNDQEIRITVRTKQAGTMANVYVEDNGSGVREEIRPHLFELPIAHPGGRPGQGLVLVRHISEMHGGFAWLEASEVGRGSSFAFSVPIAEESQERLSQSD